LKPRGQQGNPKQKIECGSHDLSSLSAMEKRSIPFTL
jgi:hypothetical protein